MTLQQLRYFLATVEHGSISAAAEAFVLAPPSVSEQIRRLEGELGVKLFARTRPRLRLTDAGREFLPHAERVVRAADEAAVSVGRARSLEGGALTFGLFRNADYYLLADVVEDFLTRHPNVQLKLLGHNSAEVAEAIRRGDLEAGLVVLPIDDQGLEVRPLLRDEVRYVTADPSRATAPVSTEQLATVPLILYDAAYGFTDPTRRQLIARAQAKGLALQPRIDTERIEAAMQLVARGIGDTIVAGHVLNAGPWGELASAPLAEPLHDEIALVHRNGAAPSAAGREFVALAELRLDAIASQTPTAVRLPGRGPF